MKYRGLRMMFRRATLFIEPMAVVEANNEISVLISQEKNEMKNSRRVFGAVFEHEESLFVSYQMRTVLDLIYGQILRLN